MQRQQFGKIDTAFGEATAALFVDADSPSEFMLHWWGEGIRPSAVLTQGTWNNNELHLVPKLLFYVSDDGGIYVPPALTDAELQMMVGTSARLKEEEQRLQGEWTGVDNVKRKISFNAETNRKPSTSTHN